MSRLTTALTPVPNVDIDNICSRFTRKPYRDAQCHNCPLEGDVCHHTDDPITGVHRLPSLAEQLSHE